MHSLQVEYLNLIRQIEQKTSELKSRNFAPKNLYLGEREYKLLRLDLNPNFRPVVMYPGPPEMPYEMVCGLRIYQVYNQEHFEITWL